MQSYYYKQAGGRLFGAILDSYMERLVEGGYL
jgi:hypothetical protein